MLREIPNMSPEAVGPQTVGSQTVGTQVIVCYYKSTTPTLVYTPTLVTGALFGMTCQSGAPRP